MIEEFMKYASVFTDNKSEVINKIEHCLREYEMMVDFAGELKFTEEEVELAGVIGLLHDIGCFDIIKIGSDGRDVDHAEHGVKVLFEDGLIKNFYTNEKYYPVIEHAIRNHDKFKIEDVDDELTMKMARLIRDVDRIDVLYLLGVLGVYDKKGDESSIKEVVSDAIKRRETVNKIYVETNNEEIASIFAFAFDINYDISLPYVKKYTKALYERVEFNEKFKDIYIETVKYLDERIG